MRISLIKEKNFVMIDKHMLYDRTISPEAKGILCFIISIEDDFEIDFPSLEYALNVGPERIHSGLKELENAGYIDISLHK